VDLRGEEGALAGGKVRRDEDKAMISTRAMLGGTNWQLESMHGKKRSYIVKG